jgi:hypothetical protein
VQTMAHSARTFSKPRSRKCGRAPVGAFSVRFDAGCLNHRAKLDLDSDSELLGRAFDRVKSNRLGRHLLEKIDAGRVVARPREAGGSSRAPDGQIAFASRNAVNSSGVRPSKPP